MRSPQATPARAGARVHKAKDPPKFKSKKSTRITSGGHYKFFISLGRLFFLTLAGDFRL